MKKNPPWLRDTANGEINYAYGKPYAYDGEYNYLYEDNGTILTDGVLPYTETTGYSVSFGGTSKPVTITIDLGAVYTDISKVIFNVCDTYNFDGGNRGFSGEKSLIYFSVDGINFIRNKDFVMEKEIWSESGKDIGFYNYSFNFNADVEAQYVKITVYSPVYVLCLNEIEVYGETSYTCEENLTWNYNDSVITISGEGEMTNYTSTKAPWYSYRSEIKSVIISNSVTSIGDFAFDDCYALSSIIIPDSVTSIGSSAFPRCTSLTSITIPDSVTSIGSRSFYNCTSLTSVTIPDSVTSIDQDTFYGCTSLAFVTIPDSVTSIADHAFSDCTSLTSVTIPDSVTSIGGWAFCGCEKLTDLYYKGTEESWNAISIGDYNDSLLNATIHFECEAKVTPKDSKYTVENGTISGISEFTTAYALSDILFNSEYTVTDANGNVLGGSALIGTGCVISIPAGDSVVVVVKGDTDGNGEVDATDYAKIKTAFLTSTYFDGAYMLAADTNSDNELDATDYARIKSHFLGKTNLFA